MFDVRIELLVSYYCVHYIRENYTKYSCLSKMRYEEHCEGSLIFTSGCKNIFYTLSNPLLNNFIHI